MEAHVAKSFDEFGFNQWMKRCIEEMGMKKPTPIQRHCIAPILAGKNVIGAAPTGSGKTAAFALPILHRLSQDPFGIYALILTPTRELALQIAECFQVLGTPMNARIATIIGGMDMFRQGLMLEKRPHIVIATPGRFIDHIYNTGLHLRNLKFLVLDEADRLCTDFVDQLDKITAALPPPSRRQTLLFSATMDNSWSNVSSLGIENAFTWDQTPQKATTVEGLAQQYMFMPPQVKACYFVFLLREFLEAREAAATPSPNASVIVFTTTCKAAEELTLMLQLMSIQSAPLHSMLAQRDRIASLMRFRARKVHVLIATDVASRGLDIPSVEMVINYDLPTDPVDYIHRVGRTARAGRGGRAVSLLTPVDIPRLHAIEANIGKKLEEYVAEEETVLKHLNDTTIAKKMALLKMESWQNDERRKPKRRRSEQTPQEGTPLDVSGARSGAAGGGREESEAPAQPKKQKQMSKLGALNKLLSS